MYYETLHLYRASKSESGEVEIIKKDFHSTGLPLRRSVVQINVQREAAVDAFLLQRVAEISSVSDSVCVLLLCDST